MGEIDHVGAHFLLNVESKDWSCKKVLLLEPICSNFLIKNLSKHRSGAKFELKFNQC